MNVCMYVLRYILMYLCQSLVSMTMNICMYACMYVCMHKYVHVHACACTAAEHCICIVCTCMYACSTVVLHMCMFCAEVGDMSCRVFFVVNRMLCCVLVGGTTRTSDSIMHRCIRRS